MLGRYLRNTLQVFYHCLDYRCIHSIPPNYITFFSLLPAGAAAILIIKKFFAWAIIAIIISSICDIVDGAVARLASRGSKLGDYLDAMVDRYREAFFYTGFALSGHSLEAFFALSGALIVSFAKARTAMCVAIDDHDWPAIGDMADRIILLILGLAIASTKPVWCKQQTVISVTLLIIGVVTYIGSIQRILYAKKLLLKVPG